MVRCAMGGRPGFGEGAGARVVVRLSPAGSPFFDPPSRTGPSLPNCPNQECPRTTRDCWKSSSRIKGKIFSPAPTSSRTCPRDPTHFRFAALLLVDVTTLATTSPAASPASCVQGSVLAVVFPPGIRHVHAAQAVAFVVGARSRGSVFGGERSERGERSLWKYSHLRHSERRHGTVLGFQRQRRRLRMGSTGGSSAVQVGPLDLGSADGEGHLRWIVSQLRDPRRRHRRGWGVTTPTVSSGTATPRTETFSTSLMTVDLGHRRTSSKACVMDRHPPARFSTTIASCAGVIMIPVSFGSVIPADEASPTAVVATNLGAG